MSSLLIGHRYLDSGHVKLAQSHHCRMRARRAHRSVGRDKDIHHVAVDLLCHIDHTVSVNLADLVAECDKLIQLVSLNVSKFHCLSPLLRPDDSDAIDNHNLPAPHYADTGSVRGSTGFGPRSPAA